jgi:hypothetical protein
MTSYRLYVAYQALKSFAVTMVVFDGLVLIYRLRTGSL